MVLCWIFQREENKLRTIHGTTNGVGCECFTVLQPEWQRNLFIAIFLNLPCCPTKFGFRKMHFTTFYFNYMSSEPDTKQQPDCDSSPGVTAAVIGARILVTLLTETLARSPLCFWVTCSFTFFFLNHQEADSVSGYLSLPSQATPQSFGKWYTPAPPCLISRGLDGPVELQPWTHKGALSLNVSMGHWSFAFATASYFRCIFIIPSNPQFLVCQASSP